MKMKIQFLVYWFPILPDIITKVILKVKVSHKKDLIKKKTVSAPYTYLFASKSGLLTAWEILLLIEVKRINGSCPNANNFNFAHGTFSNSPIPHFSFCNRKESQHIR